MKIGIVTHHYVHNFGAYLQAYALVNTVSEMVPKARVEIVDFRVAKHEFNNTTHFFHAKIGKDNLRSAIDKVRLLKRHCEAEKGLPKSKRMKSGKDIIESGYDLLIFGSDEIWNFKDHCYSPIKFGVGLSKKIYCISYAPSVGGSRFEYGLSKECIEGLKAFKAQAVRDNNAKELVIKATGKEAKIVCDPVYLYDFKTEASEKLQKLVKSKKYILIYNAHLTENMIKNVMEYASSNHMNILGAGEYCKWYNDYTVNVTPKEWLYLFEKASIVITGTFHGTSFAIKYRKRFIAYATEKNRIEKISSLFEKFDLKDRMLSKDVETFIELMNTDVDYSRAEGYINKMVIESKTYLKQQLDRLQ